MVGISAYQPLGRGAGEADDVLLANLCIETHLHPAGVLRGGYGEVAVHLAFDVRVRSAQRQVRNFCVCEGRVELQGGGRFFDAKSALLPERGVTENEPCALRSVIDGVGGEGEMADAQVVVV